MSEGSSAFDMLNSMSRSNQMDGGGEGGQAEIVTNPNFIISENANGDVFVELRASSERLGFSPSVESDRGKDHEKLIQSGHGFQIPGPDDNLDVDNG